MDLKEKYENLKADWSIRWYGFTWNLKRNAKAALEWCSNNKELTLAFLAAFGVAVRTAGKTAWAIGRKIEADREEKHHDLEIYDHSIGKWQELKRPMKYEETIEFAQRKRGGESTVEILADMGLLRR